MARRVSMMLMFALLMPAIALAVSAAKGPVAVQSNASPEDLWDERADQSWEQLQAQLTQLGERIRRDPKEAELLIQRGRILYALSDFPGAIENFSAAIALDARADLAYFGRGLARGRVGLVAEGIDDLSVYIARHPQSSLAYTKRGVRYIWLGDGERAHADLTRAIEIDADNAEAHDDLGVVYAQRAEYNRAMHHFRTAIRLEPSYQKAYHNLGMAQFLAGAHEPALHTIEQALILSPEERDSQLLKAAILSALGREAEAQAVREEAEWLPEGNWHEHAPVQ